MSMNPEFPNLDGVAGVAGSGEVPDVIPTDHAVLSGHDVFDDHYDKVGTVTDVLYDENGNAKWAVVNPGTLHREKYVPVEGSFLTDAGQVVVPYSKDMVKAAPSAHRDHILDRDVERELELHYAVAHD
jgi:uncharacterized protein YrrD